MMLGYWEVVVVISAQGSFVLLLGEKSCLKVKEANSSWFEIALNGS